MDHADPGGALARRAPVTECLKEREVAPLQEEDDKKKMPTAQLAETSPKTCTAGMMIAASAMRSGKGRAPNQIVDEDGDKTAADSGQRHLDRHKLRGVDVKLISNRVHIGTMAIILSNQWLKSAAPTGSGCPGC